MRYTRINLDFEIELQRLCFLDCESPYEEITMSGFQIRSPNYPNDYEDGLDCQLTVTLAAGLRIRVQFDSFYTYSGQDWLDIRDNSDFGDII